MLRGLISRLFKLGLTALCVGLLVGLWDFVQQAQSSDGQYSIEEYVASVEARYGDQAILAVAKASDVAQTGVQTGLTWVRDSGVLEQTGVDLPDGWITTAEDQEPVLTPKVDAPVASVTPVALAAVDRAVAPEASLLPKMRPAQ